MTVCSYVKGWVTECGRISLDGLYIALVLDLLFGMAVDPVGAVGSISFGSAVSRKGGHLYVIASSVLRYVVAMRHFTRIRCRCDRVRPLLLLEFFIFRETFALLNTTDDTRLPG